jgi:methyltransferase (TIGR00027 family)
VNRDSAIRHVADTALWMAHIRAVENRRSNAAFHDSLAALLAGDRGRRIARSIPHSTAAAWGMVIRTSAIDRLIVEALSLGVDTVLNLGAGFDTRPYRMSLPAGLRWIEVDFPDLVESKNAKLAATAPVCKVERIGMDLSDRAARNDLFARLGGVAKNGLLISEGLIPYFSNEDVDDLARGLHRTPSFRHWIQDFDNAGERRRMPKSWEKKLAAAPFLFQAKDWFEFFKQAGWKTQKVITSAEESELIHRPYPFVFPMGFLMHALPKSIREKVLSVSGAVLFKKDSP